MMLGLPKRRMSRSTQARPSDIAVPAAVVTAKATASGPFRAATFRICSAVQSSASSRLMRTQPGSGSPFGRVRRRGWRSRSGLYTSSGAARPLTHRLLPVGWVGSGSTATSRPSSTTEMQPQRERHSAQKPGIRSVDIGTSSTAIRFADDTTRGARAASAPRVVGHFGLGTGSSCVPDEARGSQLCPAYSLYVERRWRPSDVAVAYRSRESEAVRRIWRSKLAQYRLDEPRSLGYCTGASRRDDDGAPSAHSHKGRSTMQVLVGATLIDGTGASPVPDSAVVIDGERIITAGAGGSASWPAHAEVIDLSGLTLLPGLIDTHDHL